MLEAPFTTVQFFAVFAAYNAAIWPLQIPLVFAAPPVLMLLRAD